MESNIGNCRAGYTYRLYPGNGSGPAGSANLYLNSLYNSGPLRRFEFVGYGPAGMVAGKTQDFPCPDLIYLYHQPIDLVIQYLPPGLRLL